MAQILLTHSYFLKFDPKEFRAMMPYPPLGTLYAASWLRRAGFSVALHDVMLADREDEIIGPLEQHRPDLVVIYDDQFNYLSKMCLTRMRQAAFRLAQLAKARGHTVVVFSSDATDHAEEYLSHGVDYVICGEAEETLTELAGTLLTGLPKPLSLIRGLAFRENGLLIRTAPRNILEDMDVLPTPAWDLIDSDRYRRVWVDRHGYFSINMVTTRGCPFHCNWCAKPIYGQSYHTRSPEKVVEELLFLKRVINPDHVWFADDIFGLKPGWVQHFNKAVNAADTKIPFKCLSRVDLLLKEDNIAHLRQAGCETVWVGAESGSQKVLDAMEKGTTISQIRKATRLLHQTGIQVGFFLQYGYPGETREDIERTLEMVKECKPDDIGISVSYPLPGTRFYTRVKQELEKKQNWVDSGDLAMMFQGTYSPHFYRVLHRFTHKKFRVWQANDLVRKIVRRPWKIDWHSLRRIVASAYHAVTLPRIESELNNLVAQQTQRTQYDSGHRDATYLPSSSSV